MRNTVLVLTLFVAACAHTALQPTASQRQATHKRVVIMGAGRAGTETVTVHGSERTIDFEYNDRGRGPKTHTVLATDARAVTASLRTSGNDYLKAAVDEHFAIAGGNATWSNGAETGSARSGALYVSMYGPPEETAVLARALIAASGQRLPLFPAGEASIRKIGELTVSAANQQQHVTCYELTGFGFTPYPVWLDDGNELFATASSWQSVVADGWDTAVPRLIKAQDEWREAEVTRIAARLTHHPSGGGIVITNARLFDSQSLKTIPQTTIVIRANRIEAVGPDGGVPIPHDFERIDAGGRTVMAGLWDMHTHNTADDGFLNIANGVTTVRDLGNDVDFILDLRKKIESGAAIGPRMVLAGLIDGPGPFAGPTKMLVDNEEQARAAIDKHADLGYEQIKIYSSIRPELVPFMTRHAHERGMRVSGHVPAFMRAEDAVRAGFDELQHANFLFLNFMPDVKDTRTPVRFTAVAERAALIDLQSPEVKNFIELLRNHPCDAAWDARNTQTKYHCQPAVVIDPTLSIFEQFFLARKGTMAPGYAAIADRLPPQVRRGFLAGGLPVPEGMDQRYRDSFHNMLALVRALHDAHVPIVAGTDALAGFSLHRELELYVEAGIPAPEVLGLATIGAATVMHHDDQLGSIAPGKLADVIIIDGDPATKISDVRRVVTVIKDGNVFDAREVAAEIGVH